MVAEHNLQNMIFESHKMRTKFKRWALSFYQNQIISLSISLVFQYIVFSKPFGYFKPLHRILYKPLHCIFQIFRLECSKGAPWHKVGYHCCLQESNPPHILNSGTQSWYLFFRLPWNHHSSSTTFWPGHTGSHLQSLSLWCWLSSFHKSPAAQTQILSAKMTK